MGLRGPKPTREKTTHIRVPVSFAETLRNAARSSNISIAVLMDDLKDKIIELLPMPPNEGPPLPRKLGYKWSKKGRIKSK